MSVSSALFNVTGFAHADASQTAIVDLVRDPPIRLSFGDLEELVLRVAAGLLERGVRPGDTVAYLLPNGWEFVVLTAAIWRIGAAVCPMLPALREREISFIVNRSRTRILVVPEEYHGFRYGALVEAIRHDIPRVESVIVPRLGSRPDQSTPLGGLAASTPGAFRHEPMGLPPDAIAQVLFTSGTTGEPKGVLHTMRTLSHALSCHVATLGLTKSDGIWVPSPMAHQTGFLYGTMLALYLGATQISQPSWKMDLARKAIEREGATFVQAAMPFLSDLTGLQPPPRGLRIFVATGAPVPRELARKAGETLNCQVVGGWGSTESCLVTVGHLNREQDHDHWKSDGCAIAGTEIAVTDAGGRRLPPGQEGLFLVKTPAMFVGYLDHPELYQAAVNAEGFFDTGDLAVIDANGHLHIRGRRKDVINRGGEKIPCLELESILYQFDAIETAAIVGMPDARLGERICAYVVPKDPKKPPTRDEIIAYFKGRGVTKIYWPEHVEYLDSLPTTSSGKVQKVRLREMIADKARQQGFRLGA